MIIKGTQRGGAAQLARHLLNTGENEHIEVRELRGFINDTLDGALREAQAVARGTRCRQFLFSVSFNPPEHAAVTDRDFRHAARQVEKQLGLTGQPRAIIVHEKDGRRHAHCVWSRIDSNQMKAINLPHFKIKLRTVSRELYLKHGWKMPVGLVDSRERNPLNFSRAEWQQAKRTGHDPKALKRIFQHCWAVSDSRPALSHVLEERGFYLALGDRRGVVAVDFRGEVYSLARYAGVRTKDVRARLGKGKDLPSVEDVKAHIAARVTDKLRSFVHEAETAFKKGHARLAFQRRELRDKQRAERQALRDFHEKRRIAETNARAARLRRGLMGIWDRLTGQHRRTRKQNELEARQCHLRDQREKQNLIKRQLTERRPLQTEIKAARQRHAREVEQLHRDVAAYIRMGDEARRAPREQSREARQHDQAQTRPRGRGRRKRRDPGPGEH